MTISDICVESETTKKNRKNIPTKVLNLLWAKSAGRCQYDGCNDILWKDIVTKQNYNTAYIAHIVAAEIDGPRGDKILSPKLCQDYNNLMMLCDKHHRLVDKEDVIGHPIERLLEMKKNHEALIERLTNIKNKSESEVLLFGANIGRQKFPLNYSDCLKAIQNTHYPFSEYGTSLGLSNNGILDHSKEFWSLEESSLRINFEEKIRRRQENGQIKHLSVFGLAPQPLLILLGTLLGDIRQSEVYQLHREPASWEWQEETDEVVFNIFRPKKITSKIALVFSLSATITEDRIKSVLGDECSIWVFTANLPNNDFLRSKKQQIKFRQGVRLLLDEIKAVHGQHSEINVFPSMPNSLAIELGRVRMPKADLPLVIFDQSPSIGFYETLKIA